MSTGQIIGLSTINGLAWPPQDDFLWSGTIGGNIYNDNTGNVGIGTSIPNEKLTVDGGGARFGSTTAGYMRIAFLNGTTFIQAVSTTSTGMGGILRFSKYSSTDTAMTIDTFTERVGIGIDSPQYTLDVTDTTRISSLIVSSITTLQPNMTITATNISTIGNLNVTGDIYATGNITAGSDIRFKTNINTIENALSTVNNLRGVSYISIANQTKNIGVIAQEIEKFLPEVVLTDNSENKFKSVAYGNIVGLLIESIKELSNRVDKLEKLIHTE